MDCKVLRSDSHSLTLVPYPGSLNSPKQVVSIYLKAPKSVLLTYVEPRVWVLPRSLVMISCCMGKSCEGYDSLKLFDMIDAIHKPQVSEHTAHCRTPERMGDPDAIRTMFCNCFPACIIRPGFGGIPVPGVVP